MGNSGGSVVVGTAVVGMGAAESANIYTLIHEFWIIKMHTQCVIQGTRLEIKYIFNLNNIKHADL